MASSYVLIGVTEGQEGENHANTFVGWACGNVSETSFTGRFNTGLGHGCLDELEDGENNVAVGSGSGNSTVHGSSNTYIGKNAGKEGDGSNNTYVGENAGANATGSNNVFIGHEAGTENEQDYTLCIGIGSGEANYLIKGHFLEKSLALVPEGGKLGLFGKEPATQPAAVPHLEPGASNAEIIAAVNAVGAALKSLGITA